MDLLSVDQPEFGECFNVLPQALRHRLHEHPALSLDSIRELVAGWQDKDFFVSAGAPEAGAQFYSTAKTTLTPADALDAIDKGSHRILLKRLEQHAPEFRALLSTLIAEVTASLPALRRDKILRLESFLFISSAKTITPFHFDPEMGFFFQIAGNKRYHIYAPDVLAEQELESYYLRNEIDIGQVDLATRMKYPEFLFDLAPGLGMQQPSNAPHWVETSGTLSISYSFAIETERSRAAGRTRAFNGLCRRLAIAPAPPGRRPGMDAMKANCMQFVRPLISGSHAISRLIS